jgi:hypothetical protein
MLAKATGRFGHKGARVGHKFVEVERRPKESTFKHAVGVVLIVYIGSHSAVIY